MANGCGGDGSGSIAVPCPPGRRFHYWNIKFSRDCGDGIKLVRERRDGSNDSMLSLNQRV